GRGGRDARHAVFLRHVARGLRGARSERGEQEVHLVIGDEALGRLHRARRVGGVIDVDDLDLVGLAAGLDPAFGIGGLRPQVIALLLLDAFRRERAGQRQRSADTHAVLRQRGGARKQSGSERKRRNNNKWLQFLANHEVTVLLRRGKCARRAARGSSP